MLKTLAYVKGEGGHMHRGMHRGSWESPAVSQWKEGNQEDEEQRGDGQDQEQKE